MSDTNKELPWPLGLHLVNLRSLVNTSIGQAELASEADDAENAYACLILLREAQRELERLTNRLNAINFPQAEEGE